MQSDRDSSAGRFVLLITTIHEPEPAQKTAMVTATSPDYVPRHDLSADLENIVAQRIEQVVGHDADRVDARARSEHHSRAAELDGCVIDSIENSHIQLARVQEGLQYLRNPVRTLD